MILEKIISYKRQEVANQKRAVSLATLQSRAAARPPARDLAAALARPGVSLIAEIKKASPSRGLLRSDMDPAELATTYTVNGATAISVLTDAHFFQGELAFLEQIRQVTPLPLLRKDFIIDPYQVYQSHAAGADALLLIAAVLSDNELRDLLALTHELGMSALVETHDRHQLERVLPLQPRIVGINNRNLADFTVDLANFGRLRPLIPAGTLAVAESGVHDAADVQRLAAMQADAVLVGEALVTAPDTAARVRQLAGGGAL